MEPEFQYFDYLKREKEILRKDTENLLEFEKKIIEEQFLQNYDKNFIVKYGGLSFENVSLKYDFNKSHKALSDMNFRIKSGEKIGVFGVSEAGKSSIIKFFENYIEPSSGQIYLDGKDITNCDLKILRSEIEVLSSFDFFKGTLRENLFLPCYEGLTSAEAADFEKFLVEKLKFKLRKMGFEMKIKYKGSN